MDVISSPDTYTIFRNSESIATIATPATSYVDSTVAQNTDYVYGIQRNNLIGSSLIVDTNIVSTNSKPSSPQYVTPNKISSSQTIMLWIKPVDDRKGNPTMGLNLSYDVFRKNISTNEDFIQIADGYMNHHLDILTTDSDYSYMVMTKNELDGTNSTIEPQVTSLTCAPGTTLNTTTNQCEAVQYRRFLVA